MAAPFPLQQITIYGQSTIWFSNRGAMKVNLDGDTEN